MIDLDDPSAELAAVLAEPIDPRTVPVRFSRLKHMSRSPAHYHHSVQGGDDDTLAKRLGSGAHAMILGLPIVKYPGKVRRGKEWDAFLAANPNATILNGTEHRLAEGMATAIHKHPIASDLLFASGTVLEETIEWTLDGRTCSSRPDARGADVLIDLKTTRCSEPSKFARDAWFMGYHAQLSFYGRAMYERFGRRPAGNYLIAVESKQPHVVTVLSVPVETLDAGERCWRLWWERLMVCEASNEWPGYTQAIEPMPPVDNGELTLTINNEPVEIS